MTHNTPTPITGGCLCGALRYEADGAPLYAGFCYCTDCQKASGSGFIPFMGFRAGAVRLTGESRPFVCTADDGGNATRNFCAACHSLVFGGERSASNASPVNIYAGSLDDKSHFQPKVAIFTRSRPAWTVIPPDLRAYDTLPPPRPRKA